MNRGSVLWLALLLLIAVLSGCQRIFTTSLLSFLQRDPSSLSPEQQAAWAEQALASGDPEAMAQAYALIKDDPEQAYLAASLAAELSGVPQALADAIADLETILDAGYTDTDLEAFLDDYFTSIDGAYAAAAGAHFQAALANEPSKLSGQDMILGALSLAFGAVDSDGDFGSASAGEIASVDSFIADSLDILPDLPENDQARSILTEIKNFVNSGLF